jgi:hypothetical protein
MRPEPNLESIPTRYRSLYLAAFRAECSPRQALKAKCQSCVGWEQAPDRIRECAVFACPIWSFRPYQKRSKSADNG